MLSNLKYWIDLDRGEKFLRISLALLLVSLSLLQLLITSFCFPICATLLLVSLQMLRLLLALWCIVTSYHVLSQSFGSISCLFSLCFPTKTPFCVIFYQTPSHSAGRAGLVGKKKMAWFIQSQCVYSQPQNDRTVNYICSIRVYFSICSVRVYFSIFLGTCIIYIYKFGIDIFNQQILCNMYEWNIENIMFIGCLD